MSAKAKFGSVATSSKAVKQRGAKAESSQNSGKRRAKKKEKEKEEDCEEEAIGDIKTVL